MYKTVSFNIFEEHLEEIVYGKESVARRREYLSEDESGENLTRKPTEIIIKPLNADWREREEQNKGRKL